MKKLFSLLAVGLIALVTLSSPLAVAQDIRFKIDVKSGAIDPVITHDIGVLRQVPKLGDLDVWGYVGVKGFTQAPLAGFALVKPFDLGPNARGFLGLASEVVQNRPIALNPLVGFSLRF